MPDEPKPTAKFHRQKTIAFSLTPDDIARIDAFVDKLRSRGEKANRSRAVQQCIRACVPEAQR